ncbi:hypothetical protein KIH07_02755 [Hydrogenophaga taeniospiralis]|jgi:hypothetical protein|uniref:hypothetical protein n=1 Tax=Hydrogenophaga taeniospiralis TaxID=65656 RepID=UPI001CF9A7B8|nr:hypothetical protein [Hydrogenophaga taeniospiralis]MCB4362638.1 hypothetical protein [Hydrogenophaga taeniospiralis]
MTKGQQRVFKTGEGVGWLLTADKQQRAPARRGARVAVNGGLLMNDNHYQQIWGTFFPAASRSSGRAGAGWYSPGCGVTLDLGQRIGP